MLNKKRKLFMMVLSIAVAASLIVVPCNAAIETISNAGIEQSPSVIIPYWAHVNTVTIILDVTGEYVVCDIFIMALKGTTFKDGVITLEKISGANCGLVKKWTGLYSSSQIFSFKDSSVKTEQGKYRLSITITATRNGTSEQVTGYKEAP